MATKRYEYLATLRPVDDFSTPYRLADRRPSKDPKRFPFGVAIYDRPLRRDDVEHFSLVPLDPFDPINVRRAHDLFREDVLEAFARSNGYLAPSCSGSVALSHSTRPHVEFQLTYFDADATPTGHIDFDDFDEAVRALWGLVTSDVRRSYVRRVVPDA
jgi:hypothetical protein